MPETERNERGELSSDQCVIDGKHFFVLGRILIPVTDGVGPFAWLAWVSLSERNFLRMCELWERDGRETEPLYCGSLQSNLPYEPSTLGLEVQVKTMPLGERPLILFDHTVHPLSVEQHTGITMAQVQRIVEAVLHG